ncbi:hypothetical protein CDEST_05145 [Colletotrichum destructivum]|uniref:Uncharacterized protein n=1 Tax=Colletotrichum destructivum TaxID=34406 RepID=A0AAX4IAC1_9PEZI|nr:hypothetical protein CDEST_05145 [Colletotrichum destructivum]
MGILEVFQVTRKDYLRLTLDRERGGGPLMARPYCCPITPCPFPTPRMPSNFIRAKLYLPRSSTIFTRLQPNAHWKKEPSDAVHPGLKLASIRPPT